MIGLIFNGLASLLSSINFFISLFYMMNVYVLNYLTLLCIAILLCSYMLIMSLPVLTCGVLSVLMDIMFNTVLLDPAFGGDPIFYQHLFWFFGFLDLRMAPHMFECLTPYAGTSCFIYIMKSLGTCITILLIQVKIPNLRNNQQVTNGNPISEMGSNLVGTSETLRVHVSPFHHWLAGLIDGDGCFQTTTSSNLTITMGLEDEKTLMLIKSKYGGKVKLVNGKKAVKYYVGPTSHFIQLLKDINGLIYNNIRYEQFCKACLLYGIQPLPHAQQKLEFPYIMGLLDSDGSLTLSDQNSRKWPQITLKITNKHKENLLLLENWMGQIHFDKSGYGQHYWSIQSKQELLEFHAMHKQFPSRTCKLTRILLIPTFYELLGLKAHLAPLDTPKGKAWKNFWTNGMNSGT